MRLAAPTVPHVVSIRMSAQLAEQGSILMLPRNVSRAPLVALVAQIHHPVTDAKQDI